MSDPFPRDSLVLVVGGPLDGQLVPPPPDGEAYLTAQYHHVAEGTKPEDLDLANPDGTVTYRMVVLEDPTYDDVQHRLVVPAEVKDNVMWKFVVSGLLRSATNPPPAPEGSLCMFQLGHLEEDGQHKVVAQTLWFTVGANGKLQPDKVDTTEETFSDHHVSELGAKAVGPLVRYRAKGALQRHFAALSEEILKQLDARTEP